MNLATAFLNTARTHPDKPAVLWGEASFTYGPMARQAVALARHLQERFGLEPGARVGLWLRNRPEFVPALFGILQAGAVVVPINNFLKPGEVRFILEDAEVDLVVTEASMEAHFPELVAGRPQLAFWTVESLGELPAAESLPAGVEPAGRRESDLAVIIYTSGTTGHPKGAMLSNGNLLHNVGSCRQMLSAVDADRFVVILPMFHSFMLTVGVFLPLLVGGSLIVVKSLHPPKSILQEIVHHGGTILPCIPQFFRTLAHASLPVSLPLRLCISGGAPLPGEILREFNARMPMPLLEGYGLSEASPVVCLNPVLGPWKAGSIGVPIPGVEVAVCNDAGEFLPPGVTGEICVRGGNVMLGYWNQPEATAQVLRHGWLLTGDVGHRDAEGYFYITDRKKDMLLVNGINVYPREIEEVLYRLPGVREAAVIGVPDSRKGEHPLAFVALQEGQPDDAPSILHFLRGHLADYKIPRRVVFLNALPRNAAGKVLKTVLRQQAGTAAGTQGAETTGA
ncbi:MAG: long-chain fatty acid--CoA ligase [Verrucomicrobia bacterium]|nr:long-chain fatty acid--CoA ligase [Verrucomicrobiota bacterium]